MAAAREIADRIEGRPQDQTPHAVEIQVVYLDEVLDAPLRAVAMNILLRVPSAALWEHLTKHLQLQLRDNYQEVIADLEAMTDAERKAVTRRLEAEAYKEDRAISQSVQ